MLSYPILSYHIISYLSTCPVFNSAGARTWKIYATRPPHSELDWRKPNLDVTSFLHRVTLKNWTRVSRSGLSFMHPFVCPSHLCSRISSYLSYFSWFALGLFSTFLSSLLRSFVDHRCPSSSFVFPYLFPFRSDFQSLPLESVSLSS